MRFLGLESLLSFFPADATSEYTCFVPGSFRHLFSFLVEKSYAVNTLCSALAFPGSRIVSILAPPRALVYRTLSAQR